MRRPVYILCIALIGVLMAGCEKSVPVCKGFVVTHIDKSVSRPSSHPIAVDPALVGTYPAQTKAGAGYFYDEVLEYRVWLHPENGAEPLNGDEDYYAAFAQFERAQTFAKNAKGAEEPLVLIRQLEWIDEPEPGKYIAKKGERITEWQVVWLDGDKRGPNSIGDFLRHPRPVKQGE